MTVPTNDSKSLQYGLKRLAKIEQAIEERLKREAKRYNKSYPGELVHFDTKRLPLLKGQSTFEPRKYLFVAIDDFSRELHADIFLDKTQHSAAGFLIGTVIAQCPYQIDYAYSDNGKEFKELTRFQQSLQAAQYRSEVYPYQSSTNQRQSRTSHPHLNAICGTAKLALKAVLIGVSSFSGSLISTIP